MTHLRLRTCGDLNAPLKGSTQEEKGSSNMGDKSPKALRRQTTQKQAKGTAADEKRQQAIVAKQAVFKRP